MTTVSMLEFRKNAQGVIKRSLKGENILLTYRGKAVVRLEPVKTVDLTEDDPFYDICSRAEMAGTLMNDDIDRILYENP